MCQAVACKKCGKTTWAGCGQHVDQVLRGVPKANRCAGHEKEAGSGTGFFARIVGRKSRLAPGARVRPGPRAGPPFGLLSF